MKYKKILIKDLNGRYYQVSKYFHLGLNQDLIDKVYIIDNLKEPGYTISSPFIKNPDGTLPIDIYSELTSRGFIITHFKDVKSFDNWLSATNIERYNRKLKPFEIDINLPWVPRPHTLLQDVQNNLWYLDWTKEEKHLGDGVLEEEEVRLEYDVHISILKVDGNNNLKRGMYIGLYSLTPLRTAFITLTIGSSRLKRAWQCIDTTHMLEKIEELT